MNSVGEGARSGERSATPAAAATAPGAPTLNSADVSRRQRLAHLDAPRPPTAAPRSRAYRIYRGTASGGETLLTTSFGTATSYTDTSVAVGTTYWYQVSALNSVGESARSGERSASIPSSGDTIAPTTPSNMTTLLSGTTQVAIDWSNSTDNVGVTGYQVYRDGALVATSPTSWFVDSGLGASTTHTYQIRAIDAAGNRSAATITLSATTTGYGIGTTGTLSGVVFNASGDVISNAVVRVNGTTKSTRTNQNGVWTFPLLTPGSYGVTATCTSSATVTMTAVGKQTVIAGIGLS